MARYRVNLPDAVDTRAARIARSRTALVRIGVVKALNADATVNVEIGGSTFPAVAFEPYAVNDVVSVLTDTDAWWVIGRPGAVAGERRNIVSNTNFTPPAVATSSTTFSDAGLSASITKAVTASRLRVFIAVTFYTTAPSVGAEFGVRVNGVDTRVTAFWPTCPSGVRLSLSGSTILPAGVPAGVQVVTLRWRATAAAAGPNISTADMLSLEVEEVP